MIETRTGIVHDTKAIGLWLESLPDEAAWRCWFCVEPFDNFAHRRTVHHIIGSAARSQEPCNFAIAGWTCHAAIEGFHPVVNGVALETIPLVIVLRAKKKYDAANWNLERLTVLMQGRSFPDANEL